MTIKCTLEKFDSGMHFIMLTNKVVSAITINNNKRAVCKLNNVIQFHCAIMSKKEGGHFINIGSAICKKLNIQKGSIVTATFSIDDADYQFEMPEELQEVLATDNDANIIFQSLKKGNQRGLMYLVLQVKSTQKRVERALKIAERLKCGIISPKNILR